MKAVVVTGVSSGIGLATAELLARRGIHVFGSVRRAADADRAAAACDGHFTPLIFDINDERLVEEAAGEVRAHIGGERLFGLINNARHCGTGSYTSTERRRFSLSDRGKSDGRVCRHQEFPAAAGHRPNTQWQPRANRQYQFGWWPPGPPLHGRIRGVKACPRRMVGMPAA